MNHVKYFRLQSTNNEDLSELETNLLKHVLRQRHERKIIFPQDELDAMTGKADTDTLNNLLMDSGDFTLLYKQVDEVKGKRTFPWIRRPTRKSIDLVLRGETADLFDAQSYIVDQGLNVVEAREVDSATFVFSTMPSHDAATQNYQRLVTDFITKSSPLVDSQLTLESAVNWGYQEGSCCTGVVTGDIEQILNVRKVLLKGGYGIPLRSEELTFAVSQHYEEPLAVDNKRNDAKSHPGLLAAGLACILGAVLLTDYSDKQEIPQDPIEQGKTTPISRVDLYSKHGSISTSVSGGGIVESKYGSIDLVVTGPVNVVPSTKYGSINIEGMSVCGKGFCPNGVEAEDTLFVTSKYGSINIEYIGN